MAFALAQSKKEHEFALEKNKCESIDKLKSKFVPIAPWHNRNKNVELLISCTSCTSISDAPAINPVIIIYKSRDCYI